MSVYFLLSSIGTQSSSLKCDGCAWLAGLVWKVYKGHKKSTRQEAAIFVFEKRILDRWDKQEREAMLDRLRKGVSQLTRLRHPQVGLWGGCILYAPIAM